MSNINSILKTVQDNVTNISSNISDNLSNISSNISDNISNISNYNPDNISNNNYTHTKNSFLKDMDYDMDYSYMETIGPTNDSNIKNNEDKLKELVKNLFLTTLIFLAIVIIDAILLAIFSLIPLDFLPIDSNFTEFFTLYFKKIFFWVAMIIVCKFYPKNRPFLDMLSLDYPGNTRKKLMLGAIIAFSLNLLFVYSAIWDKDIEISFQFFNPIYIILLLVAIFIFNSAKDFFIRVIFYNKVKEIFPNPIFAIILSSLLFALLHIGPNMTFIGVLNVFLMSLLLSEIIYYFDSVWCAFYVHTAWSFSQTVVFGLPNDRKVSKYSVFKLTGAKDSFFYNVKLGLDGTFFTTIILVTLCALIYFYKRNKVKDVRLYN